MKNFIDKMPVGVKIVIVFAILTIVGLGSLGSLVYYNTRGHYEQTLEDNLSLVGQEVTDTLDTFIMNRSNEIQLISDDMMLWSEETDEVSYTLSTYLDSIEN